MSSSVHVGSSSRVANSCGYLETSSKPVGVLKNATIIANNNLLRSRPVESRQSENRRSTINFVNYEILLEPPARINGSSFTIRFYDRRSSDCKCSLCTGSELLASSFTLSLSFSLSRLPIDAIGNCFIEPSIDNDYSLNARCTEDTRRIITNLSRRSQLLFQRDRSPPPFGCDWCVLKQHGRPW